METGKFYNWRDKMNIFVLIFVLLLYAGITFLIGWGLMKTLKAFSIWRWPFFYWSVFAFIAGSMFLSRIDGFVIFQIIGNYWMFFLEYGLILTLLGIVFYWITPWKNIKIIGGTGVAIILILFVVGLYNAYIPTSHQLTLDIDKKADDLRVVVVSDFHLGVLSTKNHLERFVELSNEAKPDIVLLVGDIIDDDPKWFIEQNMGETLAKLETTLGVYGVLGNHEYYGDQIDVFIEAIEEAGVTMLLDETILIDDQYYLTGQEDMTNKQRLPLEELKPDDESKPWFIMNHTPLELEIPTSLQADFHVSGHTHKGQLWPNEFITSKIFEVDYGHLKKDNTHFLVSSGFGFWGPPMRIGSQAEIWVVDLNFNNEN